MVFTKLMVFLDENISWKILRELLLNKNCRGVLINNDSIVIEYKTSVDTARILKLSKHFFYRICLTGRNSLKYDPKTLTISKNCNMAFGLLEKNNGQILYQHKNIVIVKFQSFLKTSIVLQKLKQIKVGVKYTKRNDIKAIKIQLPF